MGFLTLLLVLAAVWLLFSGRLQRMNTKDGAMLGLAIVGAVLAGKGMLVLGGAPLLVATLYAVRRLGPSRRAPHRQPIPLAEAQEAREARALLGVEEGADEAAIRSAHRRLIAKIHPDAGGTQALAEKINEARNLLLRHKVETKGSHPPPSGNHQKPTGSP